MTITIRQAGPGDEAAIVRLTQEMAAGEDDVSPVDEHYARRFLASPVAGVLLAEDDGEAVGLLSYALVPGLYHAADSGLIELLIVTGTRRGEGIGHRLVDTALRAVPRGRLRRGVRQHRRGERERAEGLPRRRAHRVVAAARDALRRRRARVENVTPVSLRPLAAGDGPFLHEMLREADRWRLPIDAPRPPLTEILADPHVRLYVEGWGRPGETGFVAEVAGSPAGACWLRLFGHESHGWGFVGPDVPELSIAVAPRWRRRGIGRRLLAAAVARAERARPSRRSA